MVYLAESRSLAAMEILVHTDRSLLSVPYVVIPVEFDETDVQDLNPLPKKWNNPVPPASAAQAGDNWVKSKTSPLLRVPSVIVPGEFNYLLNPDHPDVTSLAVGQPEPFTFDSRLSIEFP